MKKPKMMSTREILRHPGQFRIRPKVGRNDLCPCGSGKKYKKCCIRKTDEHSA